MARRRKLLVVWVALWLTISHADLMVENGSVRPPSDSGRACSCSGVTRRRLDCSNRERSAFSTEELCAGRTAAIDFSRNFYTTFPKRIGKHIVEVNISSNYLLDIPRAPPLNTGTTLLDISNNGISHATNELKDLSSLRTLVICGNNLQKLHFLPDKCALLDLRASNNAIRSLDGPLNRCMRLKRLDLSGNQLVSLSRGAFSGLVNLERLFLQRAGLVSVEAGAFEGLTEVKLLDLADNKLASLPSGVFNPLKSLTALYVDGNNISKLQADIFVGLKQLEIVSLRNNMLKDLPKGIFSGLHELKYILLNQNYLRTLPDGIFYGLQNLKGIILPGNELEVIPSGLFAGLRSLQTIGLGQNRLMKLPADLLWDISSLGYFGLRNNHLTSLPRDLFRNIKSVKVLDLSSNNFSSWSGRELFGLRNISLLDLSRNQLVTLPTFDGSWPDVSYAVLDENQIVEVSEEEARSWLGSGVQRRVLSLGDNPPLRSAARLRWVLTAKEVMTWVSADCACGGLERGRAEVQFCVAVSCPEETPSWLDAVHSSPSTEPSNHCRHGTS